MSLIVITAADDAHIEFVQRHLSTEMIIIDPFRDMLGGKLSFRFKAGEVSVMHNGRHLKQVTAVWMRKPTRMLSLDIPVQEKFREYCKTALFAHEQTIYNMWPEALWVSHEYAIRRAEDKPWQLAMAAQLGFNVPETLFASDKNIAKSFVAARSSTIVKPLAFRHPMGSNSKKSLIFFATKVDRDHPMNFDGLHLAPAILQQAIKPDLDIRVIVVGTTCFAAAIRFSDEGQSAVRDWRLGDFEGSLTMEPYILPKDIRQKCIALVKRLGLTFGAIDLIRDRRGKIWFLENNANGQWAFIEERTGQPIGKAMADLLMKTK